MRLAGWIVGLGMIISAVAAPARCEIAPTAKIEGVVERFDAKTVYLRTRTGKQAILRSALKRGLELREGWWLTVSFALQDSAKVLPACDLRPKR